MCVVGVCAGGVHVVWCMCVWCECVLLVVCTSVCGESVYCAYVCLESEKGVWYLTMFLV